MHWRLWKVQDAVRAAIAERGGLVRFRDRREWLAAQSVRKRLTLREGCSTLESLLA